MPGHPTLSEIDYRAVFGALPSSYLLLRADEAFTILDASEGYLRVTHRTRDIIGQSVFAAFPEREGETLHVQLRASLERVVATRETDKMAVQRYDIESPGIEGLAVHMWRPLNVPLLDATGAVHLVIHGVEQVTEMLERTDEHDRLVAEASRERRMFEAALSTTPDLVYVFDLGKRFVYANPALLRMWGVTREAAQGKYLRELGYEDWHAAMHEREIDEVVRTGKPIRGEVPFSGTDGRRMYDYIFAPVIGADGEVVAVAGTTRDVTDRQAAEQAIREQSEQLREADRAKDEFLAVLAHELRNPLAPLRSALGVLASQERDARTVKIHDTMSRQVEHMVRLVDDLLEVSRITRGALALQRRRVAVAEVVEHALATVKPLLDENQHTVTVELPTEPLEVEGDAVRLAQIVGNLLNNAAKYTPPGGRVQVAVQGTPERVRVAVRDTGIGIEPALLPKVFDMFTRGHAGAGRDAGGLGIGLSLAHRLAELHGGTLAARSEGTGKGAEVVLELPRISTASAAAPVPLDTTVQAPYRILVVDDNVDAGDMLGMLLEAFGATVQVVEDGPAALERFGAFAPEVVFLDIGMPGMDGYEVARALRARFADRRFLLVALTGWGQDDDKRRAREAGFDRHMVKPASTDALREVLQAVPRS